MVEALLDVVARGFRLGQPAEAAVEQSRAEPQSRRSRAFVDRRRLGRGLEPFVDLSQVGRPGRQLAVAIVAEIIVFELQFVGLGAEDEGADVGDDHLVAAEDEADVGHFGFANVVEGVALDFLQRVVLDEQVVPFAQVQRSGAQVGDDVVVENDAGHRHVEGVFGHPLDPTPPHGEVRRGRTDGAGSD